MEQGMLNFLEAPPRFLFFTGKGGVGKTSLACATAVFLAEAGRRVLLVSTDPASNIAQVLGCRIGYQMTPIAAVPGLCALEMDPHQAAQTYRNRIVDPIRGVLPPAVVRSIEEQLSGACTTEIATFDEFTALLADESRISEFDHVVFDTAPTGHTLRLLQLPGAWSGFLDTHKGEASCLGPLAGLEKQHAQYQAAVQALTDPTRTRPVLVTRAHAASLREIARTQTELAALGLTQQYLVVNGLLPPQAVGDDALARAVYAREASAWAARPAALKTLSYDEIPLQPVNLVGLEALRGLLGTGVPTSLDVTKAPFPEVPHFPLHALVAELAGTGHGLIMLMGKGSVGKTTLATALALALADRGHAVHLTTSDPAAHVQETLEGTYPGLTVSHIDPEAETAAYREQILATQGKALDAQGLAVLEEELQSPCMAEIAVFQAFSRIIREADRQFVVMDTAPTGHTLLLLDATGSYDREVRKRRGMAQGEAGVCEATPLQRLQDPAQTKVLLVTLAETTPVSEAAHLQADLRRAGIEPWAWIINHSVAAAHPEAPLLRQRAQSEMPAMMSVLKTLAQRYAIVPMQAAEPVGQERLFALVGTASAL